VASPVLLSWIAVNNDPYERERDSRGYRLVDGRAVPGPTLTLLFDDDSPFVNQIKTLSSCTGRAAIRRNNENFEPLMRR
jgi:hypothetical protein